MIEHLKLRASINDYNNYVACITNGLYGKIKIDTLVSEKDVQDFGHTVLYDELYIAYSSIGSFNSFKEFVDMVLKGYNKSIIINQAMTISSKEEINERFEWYIYNPMIVEMTKQFCSINSSIFIVSENHPMIIGQENLKEYRLVIYSSYT